MMTEYGRIHTDGSRSGGQPVLKPCPFCGGRAEIAKIETEDLPSWLGECQEPPCEAVAPVRPTRDQAIAAWNTRQPTQSDALAKCLTALDDEEVVHAIDCNKVEQRAVWDSALKMCRERINAALQGQAND